MSTPAYRRPIPGYIPEVWPAVIAAALFAITSGLLWFNFARLTRRYMLTLTIGTVCMIFGYAMRVAVHYSPYSIGVFAISNLFILLSPCAFFAHLYMQLGRIATHLECENLLLIRASWITRIFVTSDVLTFLLQGSGGGLSATGNASSANMGHYLAMAGLIIQAVSLCIYGLVLVAFAVRLSKLRPEKWHLSTHTTSDAKYRPFAATPVSDWRILFYTMCVALVLYLVRSGFRIAEYQGGFDSPIMTTEWYMYVFDAIPIFLGVSLFTMVWPPRFLMTDRYSSPSNSVKMEQM